MDTVTWAVTDAIIREARTAVVRAERRIAVIPAKIAVVLDLHRTNWVITQKMQVTYNVNSKG
jgi:hypothetical protein